MKNVLIDHKSFTPGIYLFAWILGYQFLLFIFVIFPFSLPFSLSFCLCFLLYSFCRGGIVEQEMLLCSTKVMKLNKKTIHKLQITIFREGAKSATLAGFHVGTFIHPCRSLNCCGAKKTAKPERRKREKGEYQKQTRLRYGTGPESNSGHIAGKRALLPLRHLSYLRGYSGKDIFRTCRAANTFPSSSFDLRELCKIFWKL